ncbi:hypothetical protein I3843_07G145700 [Carya illinoinensis]|uniref:Uncharacterized protein n=1 Tax=Carya illinoinensis TaxID=32201 RepID=A0A8T1Q2Z9_CARIL|nr:hypothetical protein I3760_07G146100 [Carya illinoinensis]KAG6648431.1 hypothetical protein CIPAW_07G147400 [Carya illinoinensis]KAG6704797.1 hypothetical protein I3842_07G150900 [Carya illinoinensis]KAG7971643.1 hypothetical protein I3843_07G145700 [Carya illinoinensis]
MLFPSPARSQYPLQKVGSQSQAFLEEDDETLLF